MITSKTTAVIFSIITSLMVLWPILENLKNKPTDNFPLSYYPMFSEKRSPKQTLNYFVGFDAQQNRYAIPYEFMGAGGFNQMRRQLNKKVRTDKYNKLVSTVATRLARSKKSPYNKLVTLQLIRGTYHLDNYYSGNNKKPVSEKILSMQKIETK